MLIGPNISKRYEATVNACIKSSRYFLKEPNLTFDPSLKALKFKKRFDPSASSVFHEQRRISPMMLCIIVYI